MKITFHGAARTVTGSRHLVEVNGSRILLDCGMVQGKREESYKENRHLAFDARSVDAVVLSHAHIDHSGNLPTLTRLGFEGTIHTTPATADLCRIMLPDSAHVQEQDILFVNKRRQRDGLPLFNVLYTPEEVQRTLGLLKEHPYESPFQVAPGVTATYYDAGHILGSAGVALDIEEGGKRFRLAFSGDVGRKNLPIYRDPVPIPNVDYLICETTYGNRTHEPIESVEDRLADVITRTFKRGGKLIVPSFAVGRTQQLLYLLHRLTDAGRITNHWPVYVDSPLACSATDVFRKHPECFDEGMNEYINRGDTPLDFSNFTCVRDVAESKRLNNLSTPAIIISASGMCEAGRIQHHLKNNVEDARNTVFMIGFSAAHTLGRRIMNREPIIKIFGEQFELRAEVATMSALSGHADRAELLEYIEEMSSPIRKIFLVHGEYDQSVAFSEGLKEQHKKADVVIPEKGQTFELP